MSSFVKYVDHTYRDFSRYTEEGGHLQKHKKCEANFPAKLHQMLSDPAHSNIITWMPHGRCFKILDKDRLFREVIPQYYVCKRYDSFTRQLNGWGFKRLYQKGPDYGCFYHECFLRDLPKLTCMVRRLPTRDGKAIPYPAGEPDFYEISKKYPLPPLQSPSKSESKEGPTTSPTLDLPPDEQSDNDQKAAPTQATKPNNEHTEALQTKEPTMQREAMDVLAEAATAAPSPHLAGRIIEVPSQSPLAATTQPAHAENYEGSTDLARSLYTTPQPMQHHPQAYQWSHSSAPHMYSEANYPPTYGYYGQYDRSSYQNPQHSYYQHQTPQYSYPMQQQQSPHQPQYRYPPPEPRQYQYPPPPDPDQPGGHMPPTSAFSHHNFSAGPPDASIQQVRRIGRSPVIEPLPYSQAGVAEVESPAETRKPDPPGDV